MILQVRFLYRGFRRRRWGGGLYTWYEFNNARVRKIKNKKKIYKYVRLSSGDGSENVREKWFLYVIWYYLDTPNPPGSDEILLSSLAAIRARNKINTNLPVDRNNSRHPRRIIARSRFNSNSSNIYFVCRQIENVLCSILTWYWKLRSPKNCPWEGGGGSGNISEIFLLGVFLQEWNELSL